MSVVFLDTEGTNSKLLTGNFPMSSVTSSSCRTLGFFAVWECHSLCQTSLEFHEALCCLLALPPGCFLEVSAAL